MSLQAVEWALAQRVGSGHLKATLVAIACCHRDDVWPVTREQIEAESGLTDRTVSRHLKDLSDRGFITVGENSVSLSMEAGS